VERTSQHFLPETVNRSIDCKQCRPEWDNNVLRGKQWHTVLISIAIIRYCTGEAGRLDVPRRPAKLVGTASPGAIREMTDVDREDRGPKTPSRSAGVERSILF
jgi:hypothetical protein